MQRLDRAGLAAVLVVLALVGVVVVDRVNSDDAADPTPDPVDALVDAFSRSRIATYRIAGTWVREQDGGHRLELPVEIVQRRPDRLRRHFGEISGHRGDRALLCPAARSGQAAGDVDGVECTVGPPSRTFDELAAEETAEFRALVTGDDPLYEVRRPVAADDRPGWCWVLTRSRSDPRGGYGEEAELCFDPGSGALVESTIDHGDITERQVFTEVTTEVTDDMLEP